ESVYSLTAQRRLSAPRPPMAAINSMRLLVVADSAPETSLRCLPATSSAAQPPGPGLPRQAPSVYISTRVDLASVMAHFGGGFGRADQHPLPGTAPRPHQGQGGDAFARLEHIGAGHPGGPRLCAGARRTALGGQQSEIAVHAVDVEAEQRHPVA